MSVVVRRFGAAIACVAMAFALTTCNSGGSSHAKRKQTRSTSTSVKTSRTTVPNPTTTTRVPASTQPSDEPPADLAGVLPDTAPVPFVRDQIDEGLAGSINQADLATAYSTAQGAFFGQHGFERGYGRSWTYGLGGSTAVNRIEALLVFKDAAGAAAARDYTDDSRGERDRATFPVTGIADAIGRTYALESFGQATLYRDVVFTRGKLLCVVSQSTPEAAGPPPDQVASAARELSARLQQK
jgi:hypothetical protein